MFCLLVPSHSPWSACGKSALITFVCLAIVHCLPVNIQVATAAGLILARATLKLHPLMSFVLMMCVHFLQNFAFKVTLVACVLYTIMVGLFVLFSFNPILGPNSALLTVDNFIGMKSFMMPIQRPLCV